MGGFDQSKIFRIIDFFLVCQLESLVFVIGWNAQVQEQVADDQTDKHQWVAKQFQQPLGGVPGKNLRQGVVHHVGVVHLKPRAGCESL